MIDVPVISSSVTDDDIRRINTAVKSLILGGGNNTIDVELSTGTGTTVVTDTRIGINSAVVITSLTSAAAVGSYFYSANAGSVSIHHSTSTAATRTVRIAVTGS